MLMRHSPPLLFPFRPRQPLSVRRVCFSFGEFARGGMSKGGMGTRARNNEPFVRDFFSFFFLHHLVVPGRILINKERYLVESMKR